MDGMLATQAVAQKAARNSKNDLGIQERGKTITWPYGLLEKVWMHGGLEAQALEETDEAVGFPGETGSTCQ
jgi:hypothetical protein